MSKRPLHTFKYMKSKIVDKDFNLLISSSLSQHVSVRLVAAVAESSSWRRLWDIALDKGVKGTRTLQFRIDCVKCVTSLPIRTVLSMLVNNSQV